MEKRMGQRQEAQFYLERLCRDLALSTGDHYNARAVAEQLELFTKNSAHFCASEFYAIAGLVERCVYRALNIDSSKSRLEIEMHIRRKLVSYDQGPSVDELLANDKPSRNHNPAGR